MKNKIKNTISIIVIILSIIGIIYTFKARNEIIKAKQQVNELIENNSKN